MAKSTKPTQESFALRTKRTNVKGVMQTYEATGKIGNITPRNEAHARRIARGIARSTEARAKTDK